MFLLQPALWSMDDATLDKNIKDSQIAAEQWLKLVDANQYGESWDAGALSFKLTIPRDEWIVAEQKLRQPLGAVKSRQIFDVRWAENPQNLPQGEYMVFAYNTAFQNRENGRELVTLVQGDDGAWRVLTYAIQ